MNPAKVVLVTLLAGGISIGTAIFGERWLAQRNAGSDNGSGETAQLQTLPDFRLPDLSGREVASSTWAGKVLVLNYWASWCPPCLREMPMMIRAQEALRERGVEFVGIAVDRPEDVRSFVADYPLDYLVLIGSPESVELSRRLGNRFQGLPFTVVFDAQGRRVFSRTGEVEAEELASVLDAVLGGTRADPQKPDNPNPTKTSS